MQNEIDFWTPSLTVIALTANDYGGQTSLTSYKTNLQTLITRALVYGDVLLTSIGVHYDENTSAIKQQSYVDIVKQLAITNNCAYLDIHDRWNGGVYAQNILGFLANGDVHPTASGHQDIATAILRVIDEY